MSPSVHLSPVAVAAVSWEIGLIICGAWLLWRLALRRDARRNRVFRLWAWTIQPIDFACFLCFAFVGATTLSAAAGYFSRSGHLGADATAVLGGAVMHAGILVGLAGFYLAYGDRSSPPGDRAPLAAVLVGGLATFLIAMPLVDATGIAWDFILTKLGLPAGNQDMVDILQNNGSAVTKGALVAVATLLVPVTEEYVFRAGLFRYFRTRMPRRLSIVLTSLLFGALHVNWGAHTSGLSSLAPLAVLAMVFCVAYERTGAIGTTIVAHALFNLNTFVIVVAGVGT